MARLPFAQVQLPGDLPETEEAPDEVEAAIARSDLALLERSLTPEGRRTLGEIEWPIAEGVSPHAVAAGLGLTRHELRHRRERLRREIAGEWASRDCRFCGGEMIRPRPDKHCCSVRCRVYWNRDAKCATTAR